MSAEELARKAFMAYHNYSDMVEDWDRLPATKEKWQKVINTVLTEINDNLSKTGKQLKLN